MTEDNERMILRYLQGQLLPEELKAFELWLSISEENQKTVLAYRQVWSATDTSSIPNVQPEVEWGKLETLILADKKTSVRRLKVFKSNTLKIAAALLVLMVSSTLVYFYFFKVSEVTIQTCEDTRHITLPDGSEVWLNTWSHIAYNGNFTENRLLKLEGEAFFDVKPNPEKPFIIQTEDVHVKVVGTSFNVKARKDEAQLEVYVITGKVNLSPIRNTNNLSLTAGNKATFLKKDNSIDTELIGDVNIVAWKNKKLIFNKTPLSRVVKTLRSYFKKDIRIKSEALQHCRFTGSFNDPTLEEVVETLDFAFDIEILSEQDTYVLDGAGCKEK